MNLVIDKFFLIIAIIAIPNLYYIPQYNVPLLLFFVGICIIVYLLILSWFIDAFRLMRQANPQRLNQYPNLVIIISIIIFVLKLITLILMLIYDLEAREALNPANMTKKFKNTFILNKQQ